MAQNNAYALPFLIVILATFMAISEQAACPANSTMNKCGNQCEPSCDPIWKNIVCPRCHAPACACNEGFFRNPQGQCVVMEECPTQVLEIGETIACDMPCPQGQECRARQFTCFPLGAPCKPPVPECRVIIPAFVQPTFSPIGECPANSTMDKCGGMDVECGPTCDDSPSKIEFCPSPNCPGPACVCNKGFYLNSKGQCVVMEECPIRVEELGFSIRCGMACPEGKECWARQFQCFPAGAPCREPLPECIDPIVEHL